MIISLYPIFFVPKNTMKLTTEELLRAANVEISPVTKVKFQGNDVLRFVDALNIKEGKRSVKLQFIYKAYKLWSAMPVVQRDFVVEFNRIFRVNGGWYNINLRPMELLNKVDKMK